MINFIVINLKTVLAQLQETSEYLLSNLTNKSEQVFYLKKSGAFRVHIIKGDP